MSKNLNILLLVVSGWIAALFIANLLVHFLFYLLDGNMGKFLSPIWMTMNGIMVVFCVVFVLTWRKEARVSH